MRLERRTYAIAIRLALPGAIAIHANNAHAQNPPLPALGAYGRLDTWCGHDTIPRDMAAIPSFGCFILSPRHSAIGTFAGHQIEVSVDEKGRAVFKADNTVVLEIDDKQKNPARFTNIPYVHPMSVTGYSFCQDTTSNLCSSKITVFANNPDKTVLFIVSRCLPPDDHVCVDRQENWDYEVSRRK
jgi:hypothetical protein